MASYSSCPNCGTRKRGTKVRRCTKCGKTYCQECNAWSMMGGPKCPSCGHTAFSTEGTIS